MAERRMFAKMIVDSDIFLDMPASTQNLYFHLNIRADDEGFVNAPKKIMRMIGANQNDLEILLAKRYLLSFESGVVVVKHWLMHNTIRKDRMTPTVYTEERKQISIKENKSYTDRQPIDNQLTTNCTPSVVECSVVKSSIVKCSEETVSKKPTKHKYGEYKHVLLTDDEYNRLLNEWGIDKLYQMIKKLDEGIQMKGYKYKDHNLVLRKWEKKENTSSTPKFDKWNQEPNFEL